MELKFENVSLKNKNKYLIKNLNLIIKENELTGIIDEFQIIKQLLNNNYDGNIKYDENKKIKYVDHVFLTKTVSDEFFLIKKSIDDNNYIDKIISSLNLVGLNKNYLERNINSLSKSEKTLITIALSIITNPDIIIFDNIFKNLDYNYKKNIKKLIYVLKKKYNKMVIIIDNDINILYEICTYLIIFGNKSLLLDCPMKDAFNNLKIFDDNSLNLPFIVEFVKLAEKYGKKLKYHKDINDLIKEVYKCER